MPKWPFSMSTQAIASEYMLLFRGTRWDKGLSPEEIQKIMIQTIAWFEQLTQQGKIKGGHPLMDQGKVVSGKSGRSVVDGPFPESKEAIGGYLLLVVDNMDEAIEIAKGAPALAFGLTVEVRAVADESPSRVRAREQLAQTLD